MMVIMMMMLLVMVMLMYVDVDDGDVNDAVGDGDVVVGDVECSDDGDG